MPDFMVKNIDEKLAVRIKDYARDRSVTLNEGVLELLAAGLDSRGAHAALSGPLQPGGGEVRTIGGSWSGDEAAAFAEAMRAMERLPR